MTEKQPKHRVTFESHGGYDGKCGVYIIDLLSIPPNHVSYGLSVDIVGHEEMPQLRELMESVAKFLDAEWETRLDYPYEITARL